MKTNPFLTNMQTGFMSVVCDGIMELKGSARTTDGVHVPGVSLTFWKQCK